ncbi:MAG: FAD-dependent oxidoreductase [Alcaligenaceae bacterium]|nr:FAD-dependent oxidoreductase [Alcaligenaceae bacterium]
MLDADVKRSVVLFESVHLLKLFIQAQGIDALSHCVVLVMQEAPYPEQNEFQGLGFEAPVPLSGIQNIHVPSHNIKLCFAYGDLDILIPKLVAQVSAFHVPHNTPYLRAYLRMATSDVQLFLYADDTEVLASLDLSLCQHMQFQSVSAQYAQCGHQSVRLEVLTSQYERAPRDGFKVIPSGKRAIVVGAGLAGAGAAYSLAQAGYAVKVFDPVLVRGLKGAQAGHLAAAMTPVLTKDDDYKARLSRHGCLLADRLWKEQSERFEQVYRPCGTLELKRPKGHAKDLIDTVKSQDWPTFWVHTADSMQAQEISGVKIQKEGVYFPYGKLVYLEALLEALLTHERIELVHQAVERYEYISGESGACKVYTITGEVFETDVLALANGLGAKTVIEHSDQALHEELQSSATWEHMHVMGGEVAYAPEQCLNTHPQVILGSEGYFLPAYQNQHVLGSTYIHNQVPDEVSADGQKRILEKMVFSDVEKEKLLEACPLKGWAGSRVVRPGRLPLMTPLYKQDASVWLLNAYASHGLTWASLAGELMVTVLRQEPLLIERDLWEAVQL